MWRQALEAFGEMEFGFRGGTMRFIGGFGTSSQRETIIVKRGFSACVMGDQDTKRSFSIPLAWVSRANIRISTEPTRP
jgi:hypothetical protein